MPGTILPRVEELEPRTLPSAIGITASEAARLEGNAGTTPFSFTFIRSGDVSGASSVDYAVSGTANAADFGGTLPSGTVNFAAGETSRTLTITVSGDATDEANESFTVTISNPVNTTITTATAIGTILDDDGPVRTVTSTANSGAGSLREVIAAAPDTARIQFNLPANSTITLTSGEIAIPAGRNLIIDGTTATNLTISGNNASRIFLLNSTSVQSTSLVVRGLSLVNGNAGTGRGGAIGTAGELSIMVLDDVTFSDNRAAEGGAVFSAFRGVLTVSNSRFFTNDSTSANSEQGGGAIFFFGPNGLTVRNSTFEANRGINGGAINNLNGRVTIVDSVFRNNDVLAATFATGQPNDFLRGYGGALYSDRVSQSSDPTGGTYRVIRSSFENNTARAAGGAMYLFTGTNDALEIRDSSFTDNSAVALPGGGEAGNGGAIELQSDTINRGLVITGSVFARNRAVDRGGAIRMRNFPGTFSNNTFDDNRTTLPPTVSFTGGLGGAIEMGGGVGVQVFARNNTFSNNFATWTGGAILAGVTLRADNNIFDRNTTDTFGTGGNPILSHVDGSNLSGSNNIQSTSNLGLAGNLAIPGGTTTADPGLLPLANNGGLTLTRALPSGSPAIDAGSNANLARDFFDADTDGNTTEAVPVDQRGPGFARIVGGTVDVGAFEFGNVPGTPVITISGPAPRAEGNSGFTAFTFTVTRIGSTAAASSVTFAVSANGANPADPADFGGAFPSGIVSFAIGEASKPVTILVVGDAVRESDETFSVTLANPTSAVLGLASATATIVNDDALPGGGGGTGGNGFRTPTRYAVAAGFGGSGIVTVANADGSTALTVEPFLPAPPGGIRTATADVTGDGIDDLIVGTGPGVASRVRVFDGASGDAIFEVAPFEAAFLGGVFVAAGDLDGDGRAEIVVSPDEGGGPRVQVYAGNGFAKRADFFGIDDPNFRGGARVAIADVTGDRIGDLLVAAGFGGGPRLAGFGGPSVAGGSPTRIFDDFFVFEQTLTNGVYITGGDLDGDGFAEVIAGGGPGGGPRIFALNGANLLRGIQVQRANFFAGDDSNRGGVRITAKDLDGDSRVDLLAASGTGATPKLVAYAGLTIPTDGAPPLLRETTPFEASFLGGVFVG